ncbi:hypothetical protein [Opitutus sp. ER46]|uniref:hypothetical protein n=1 Tax=Opitutus sp. ER46 TaxID=2161864 RepID=UPI0011B249B6|nr:hypothetical protein [Opitutus sp. ER46]
MRPLTLRAATWLVFSACALLHTGCAGLGDPAVIVSSSAVADYTARKFQDGRPVRETYVFMPGRYYPGATVDRSLERMSFRQLAEPLAQELARKQYFPAPDLKSADLLIVVHWGVTDPRISSSEMRGQVTYHFDASMSDAGVDRPPSETDAMFASNLPEGHDALTLYPDLPNDAVRAMEFEETERLTDQLGGDMANANAILLLGYSRQLRQLSELPFITTAELALRSDLKNERYFIVLRAYDLRHRTGRRPRVLWTLHLNMRSAGVNFREAMASMGDVAVHYVGRNVDQVETALPKLKQGTVTIGEVKIIGEAK